MGLALSPTDISAFFFTPQGLAQYHRALQATEVNYRHLAVNPQDEFRLDTSRVPD